MFELNVAASQPLSLANDKELQDCQGRLIESRPSLCFSFIVTGWDES